MSLGYAFATTSYRKHRPGDSRWRRTTCGSSSRRFAARIGAPAASHVTGVSEGGLVATLLAEQSPDIFSSALAACAPIGSFRQQVNYLGDFRALFDYYFPGVLPGSPVAMPPGRRLRLRCARRGLRSRAAIDAALMANRPRRSS